MKLRPCGSAVVAALLLSSMGRPCLLADEAPGYLSRIVGGAKNLLPKPSNTRTTDTRSRQSSPKPPSTTKLGQGNVPPARPVPDKRKPAIVSGVEPAGWNATAEQQAAASKMAVKAPARPKLRSAAKPDQAKPPRTVSQFMAQERP